MTAVTSRPTAAKSPRSRRPTIEANGMASSPPTIAAPITAGGRGGSTQHVVLEASRRRWSWGATERRRHTRRRPGRWMKPKLVTPPTPNWALSPRQAIASTPDRPAGLVM